MKRATAKSRCEVGGVVYMPGDEMTLTEEQFQFLKDNNAAEEIPIRIVSPVFNPPTATIEEADKFYQRLVGKARPKKEK